MATSLPDPTALRAAMENQRLGSLWNSYHESSNEERLDRLVEFLDFLVKSEVISTGFENESNVTQVLYQLFIDQIEDRIGESVAAKLATFDYLVSKGGFLLILALSKLSKRSSRADPTGLCDHCVQAASSILDLPTSALSSDQFSQFDSSLVALASYKYESIDSDWLHARPLPQRFQKLFSHLIPSDNPSSELFTTQATISDETPLGFVCFYLLDIIGNLACDDFALTELYSSKRLDSLLLLLSRNPQDSDDGLITVHRKLTRTLSKIIANALRSGPKWIPVLISSPLIPTLLEASANSQLSSNLVLQEICQCLVFLLVDSSRYSFELLELFDALEGFVIFGKNLEEIDKSGTVEQQILLLRTICQLLFLNEPKPGQNPDVLKRLLSDITTSTKIANQNQLTRAGSSPVPHTPFNEDTLQQVSFSDAALRFSLLLFKTLQTVLTNTKSYTLKTTLFSVIMETLLAGVTKQRQFADAGPLLANLLSPSWFDEQSLHHRHQVLKIAKQIALTSGLNVVEIALYFRLYSTTSSISTAVLLAVHLADLIKAKAILSSKLTEVGFGMCIFRFLEIPTPGQGIHEIVLKELSNCHQIFTNAISETAKLKVDTETLKPKVDEYAFRAVATLLTFTQQYFTDNQLGVEPILASNEPKLRTLMTIIKDKTLSRPALHVLVSLAIGDTFGQSGLLKEAMSLLNHSELQATLQRPVADQRRMDHLTLYTDVLGTLKHVISLNVNLKDTLRNNGGFTWLLANIKIALSAWIPPEAQVSTPSSPRDPAPVPADESPETTSSTSSTTLQSSQSIRLSSSQAAIPPSIVIPSSGLFLVLTELISTLGHFLKGNFASKEGFAWGWFKLNDMLAASTKLFEDPNLVVGLADAFLSIATTSGWPAACPSHQKPSPGTWSPGFDSSTSPVPLPDAPPPLTQSLAISRQHISDCPDCRDALLIELPQAFKLIIDHLGRFTEVTTGVTTEALDEMADEGTFQEEEKSKKRKSFSVATVSKDDNETAYIVILKSCKLLLDEHPSNARILSSIGTCLHILTGLKALLLLEKVTSSSSRQPLLLQLVEKIASYSISLAELHKFIELLRVPTCPINFLQTLSTIASRTISSNFTPQAFIAFPKARDAVVRSPSTSKTFADSTKWPPRSGYTISLWFSFDQLPEATTSPTPTPSPSVVIPGISVVETSQAEDPLPVPLFDLIRLFSLEASQDRKQTCVEALLTTKGHLHLRSSVDTEGIVFEGFQFSPGNWYHLTISQTRSPPQARSNKHPSQVTVWVNGLRTAAGSWSLPEHISTSNFSATFGTSSRSFTSVYATSTLSSSQPIYHASQSIPSAATPWQLSNAILFDIPFQTDSEALGLYMLGPNYTGGFSGINLRDFVVHNVISPSTVARLSPENGQLLLAPDRINLHSLHEHMFCFFSSSEKIFACRSDGGLKQSLKSRSGDLEALPAELVDVSLAARLSVSDVIQYAGGLSTLLYYFVTAQHQEQQKLALRIIIAMISWHAQNARELRESNGYLLIARVIRKLEWVIDEELVSIVFSMVGISKSIKRNSYSDGVINNIDAFHSIILDWKVWKHTPNRIKTLIFKSIADLVSTSENASFNAWYLRQAGARSSLLLILEDSQFPYQLAQYAITAIAYLMNDPWTLGDMKAILRFLIATHPIEPMQKSSSSYGLQNTQLTSNITCPLGVAHKLVHFNGIQAHSLPVRFEMMATEESEGFSFLDDAEDIPTIEQRAMHASDQVPPSPLKRQSTTRIYPGDDQWIVDPDVGPVRDLILHLLLDMLQKASSAIIMQFFTEVCPKEAILPLLQTPVLSSRVTLLKILEVFVKQPGLAVNFSKLDSTAKLDSKGCTGYRLLGEILRRFEAHDDILTVLFTMLFGRPVSYHMLKTSGVIREEKQQNQIANPELVSTLLILITACGTEMSKKHSVIQIIYDIALHSDAAKNGFLQCGLVEHLCHLFVFELEHRIGKLSATFRSSSGSVHSKRPTASDGEDDGESIKGASSLGADLEAVQGGGVVRLKGQRQRHPQVSTGNSSYEEDDPYDYTIEQDVLRFLRTLIISLVDDGDGALSNLQQVLGVIRTLPLPIQYVSILQKQVSYEALELLNSFDFSSNLIYERMQKICTFIVNLTIYLERSATQKTYQLSRYSSTNLSLSRSNSIIRPGNLSAPATPLAALPAMAEIQVHSVPSSPSVLSSSTSSAGFGTAGRSKAPSRRVSFWEILDSFDSPRDPPEASTASTTAATADPKSPTRTAPFQRSHPTSSSSSSIASPTPSTAHTTADLEAYSSKRTGSGEDSSTATISSSLPTSPSVLSGETSATTSPTASAAEDPSSILVFDSANSGSETDGLVGSIASVPQGAAEVVMAMPEIVDLTAEEFSIVTRRAWSSGDFLVDDKQLVDLIFKVFEREIAHKKANTSAFKKFGETLKHKMVGVSSLDDIATNVSWHVERLIFHIIKDRPLAYPKLVEMALAKVASMAIPGSFLSETEFLSRFMKYSSRLLGGSDTTWISSSKQTMSSSPELSNATLSCWKNLITSTSSRVMSKILSPTTIKLIQDSDGSSPINPSNIHWSDSLPERISRIEAVDSMLRREWSKLYKQLLDEYSNNSVALNKQTREVTRKISDRYLKKVEGVIKPSLKLAERAIQAEKFIRQLWKDILSTVTHERAAWPIQRSLLRWELDPTEGPLRTRLRLMPVYAHHHPIIGGEGYIREKYSHDPKDVYLTTDLDAKKVELLKALENQLNESELGPAASNDDDNPVPSKEQVVKYFACSRITPFHKRDGELVIGAMNVYFIDSHRFKDAEEAQRKYTSVKKHSTWPYDEIKEIHKRRHLLINNALEIFLINGRTYLLSFRSTKERDTVYDMLVVERKLPNFVNYESEVFIGGKWTKMSITDKWRKGLITNFEYLMHLNTLAGRTYNDLTQYPVFPYILKNYTSSILQLDSPSAFREFDLPMGAQDPQRLLKFIEKYEALLDLKEEKPYFYGSHYSNVGAVLHFLIRLEPYSQFFIEFQSGRFDVPDRVFHSVGQSWELSSSQSQSDVKELIPEFFYLPEFLRNSNRFKFGSKQDGTKVDDVVLPTWAHLMARTFIYRHMEALESEHVSFHLHQWIDLIFGYRQIGEEAILARNQFHPYTYEGAVDISKITDPIERDATITQINSYGQTPTQLFKERHPKRSENYLRASNPDGIHVVPHKLQVFPALPWVGVRKLHYHNGTPVALGPRQELLWPGGSQYLQWGNWDGSLRAINLKTKQVDFEAQLFTSFRDRLTCVDVSKDGRVIVAGSESGLVRIWQKTTQTHINKKKETITLSSAIAANMTSLPPAGHSSTSFALSAPTVVVIQSGVGQSTQPHNAIPSSTPTPAPTSASSPGPTTNPTNSGSTSSQQPEYTPSAILSGHSVDVSCIKASSDQSIIVSGAKDGSVIVWDSNRLMFVRSLLPSQPSNNPVTITHIEVMTYTSEIVVIEDHLKKGTSSILLLGVNGEKIASRTCTDKIGAVATTSEKPGLARNIIITGHNNGDIKFWSAFDLAPIKTLDRTQQVPVTALCVSDDFGCLFAGHASTGIVTCHATKPARFIS